MIINTKHISILTLVTLYVIQMCFVFSGSLINSIQENRHQNQITKNLSSETISITLSKWQLLDNKKEIELNHVFYDVVSYKIVSNKVIVKLVKDSLESKIRIAFQNIFHKSKQSKPDKIKFINSYNFLAIIPSISTTISDNFNFIYIKKEPFFIPQKTKKVTLLLERPPC